MKKKSLNIILGIASLAIYGGIGYRVLPALMEDAEPAAATTPATLKSIDDFAEQKDTVTLRLNYRNPFGGSPPLAQPDTSQKPKRIIKLPRPQASAIRPDMSFVKYAGFINNPGSKKTLVMLLINGKSAMLQEGETADGIKLLKITKDSLKISYHSQISYLVKSS